MSHAAAAEFYAAVSVETQRGCSPSLNVKAQQQQKKDSEMHLKSI
jgi:hypothetical protein